MAASFTVTPRSTAIDYRTIDTPRSTPTETVGPYYNHDNGFFFADAKEAWKRQIAEIILICTLVPLFTLLLVWLATWVYYYYRNKRRIKRGKAARHVPWCFHCFQSGNDIESSDSRSSTSDGDSSRPGETFELGRGNLMGTGRNRPGGFMSSAPAFQGEKGGVGGGGVGAV